MENNVSAVGNSTAPVKTIELLDPRTRTVRKFTNTPDAVDKYIKNAQKAEKDMLRDSSFTAGAVGGAGLFAQFLYDGIKRHRFYPGKAIATGIFTALGDSKTPLLFLIFSSILNVGLDLLFVITFKMGVAGAAWATVIAQGLASILAMITLFVKLFKIKTEEKYKKFSWSMLKKTSFIAVPSVLQQSFVSLGNLFIQGLVNSFGSSVMAGYTAAVKLNTFTLTVLTTLSNGLSSYCAQNIGAGKTERLPQGVKAGVVISLFTALPFFVAFFFFPSQMTMIFLDSASEQALATGCEFLRMVAPFYFVICLKIMADGVFRGAGAMKIFMFSTFSDLLLRVVLAYILSPSMGATGIWTSWPIGWSLATVFSVFCYFKGVWKPKRSLV